jgi:protoporphyrinogen/coproporphyrinogen III oxidase
MAQICIIGGGISGLATATWLAGEHDVCIAERSKVPGGWVRSIRGDHGQIIDLAANGWLDNEPAVDRLLSSLSLLEERLQASDQQKMRWIYHRDRLHRAPLSPPSLLATRLLSLFAKLRLCGEPFVGEGAGAAEESLADFMARRLGRGVLETLIAPMVAGVFAAQPEEISVRAAFPRLLELEKTHGSLFTALLKGRGGEAPRLTTLKGGTGRLAAAMAERLGDRIEYGREAVAIEQEGDGWRIHFSEGELSADVVVLACPAYAQAAMLRSCLPETSHHLEAIRYTSVAVASSLFPAGMWDRSPAGFGALSSRGSDLDGALGVLFSSRIFPDHSPDGVELTRTIFGGTRHPEVMGMDREQLLSATRSVHRKLFGTERAAPLQIEVFKHYQAIPIYEPGHHRRQLAVQAAQNRHPGLYFVGNHLFGVAVKDCIRNAEAAALRIAGYLCTEETEELPIGPAQ